MPVTPAGSFLQETEERKVKKIDKKDLFDRMATENAVDRGATEGN